MSLEDDLADPEGVAANQELRDSNRRLQIANGKLKASKDELVAAVYLAAKDAALATPQLTVVAPPIDKRKGDPEAALWHLTDWQGGKRTPSYDSDVMEQRVQRFIAKALHITDIQRAHHPVKQCTIAFGGDLLEGISIFPGQSWQVDSTLFAQVFRVAALVEATVLSALGAYETVHVVFEPGNHGRMGGKHDGLPAGDNFDRIIGEIVRQRLLGESRLTWVMEDAFFQRLEIGNYAAMLIHGDEIRGFGGNTPAYALTRKGNAWASGAALDRVGVFDFRDIFVGHYHQPMQLTLANGGQIYMTGSTESGNAYAAEFVAATSVPSQRLMFIDPDKGRVSSSYVIWLD